MRCSPDNAHRRPPPSLCKMGNFCGGNGHRPAPSPPAVPSIVQRWKVPEPDPGHGARGVPQLWDRQELGCQGIGSGSVGAVWLPSPSPLRKCPPLVCMGTVLGLAPPQWAQGWGAPLTLQQHRQRPSQQPPLLMLIRASLQERCKISPQRGFCVLGESGWAGGALSIHLPPFPPFFVSQRS